MRRKYRAIILGADNQKLEDVKFPLCKRDRSAKDTVKSYAKALHPDHKFVELWNGLVKVAKFNRDGEEVDFTQ
jgi:hypothetical protein